MPGTRVSEGRYLEVLEPSALVNLPIEVDIYDGANPATMLATMERAQDAALQVQLSELGAGRFAVARSDPKASLLTKGNLVKIKTGGKYRGAFWIEEPEETLTSTQEAAGELIRVAGRGPLAYLERAVVYPPVWPTQPAAYRSASKGANAAAGALTLSIAKPSGTTNGDLMIAAIVFLGGSGKVVTAPPGWKEFRRVNQGSSIAISFCRKQAGSSEAGSYQWVFGTSTAAAGVILSLYNAGTDYTEYVISALSGTSGTAITNPTLDVGTVDGMLLTFAAADDGDGSGMTPPVAMTEAVDETTHHTGNTARVIEAAYVSPGLGPTGEQTTTNSASAKWIGVSLWIPSTATNDVAFAAETPGAILSTLIDRAHTRGAITDLTYTFTGAADSAGQPWPDTFDLTFHAGTTLLDVWRQLVALGMEGECTHDLVLGAYVDRTRDRTADVILRKGYHFLGNVENRAHLSGIRSRLLVEGAGGRMIEVTDPVLEAVPVIGRREGFLSMATSDAATDLARAGTKSLELSSLEDQARSIPVAHGLLTVGHYEPWEDYRPGDRVGLDPDGTGIISEERIVGITIAQAGPLDYFVTLDLNAIALEASIRMRRELDALSGTGSHSAGGSSLGLGAAGGGGGSGNGQVAATSGDTLGYLFDKIDAGSKMLKTLGYLSVPGNRTVELDVNTLALGTGTPTIDKFLRGDGAWAAPPGGTGAGAVKMAAVSTTGASPNTITKPVETADGDLLLWLTCTTNSVPNVLGPDGGGWTLIQSFDTSSSEYQVAWYKIASGEGASWSMTHSAGSDVVSALIVFRGISSLYNKGFVADSLITPPILGTAAACHVCVWFSTTGATPATDLVLPAHLTSGIFARNTTSTNKPQVLVGFRDSGLAGAVASFVATGGAAAYDGSLAIVFAA